MKTSIQIRIARNDRPTLRPVDPEWRRLARSARFQPGALAELTGVSLRTLQRRFRSEYNTTVSDWLKTIRLSEASDRVRAGEQVKHVAMDLGYKQLSHFSREFKRAYGKPPSIVRQRRPSARAHNDQNS